MRIDSQEFRRLWESGTPAATIAGCFGLTMSQVYKLRRELSIKSRDKIVTKDPTPSQIAERAAALREKHLAEMRAIR